jgi:hypothetical protein
VFLSRLSVQAVVEVAVREIMEVTVAVVEVAVELAHGVFMTHRLYLLR